MDISSVAVAFGASSSSSLSMAKITASLRAVKVTPSNVPSALIMSCSSLYQPPVASCVSRGTGRSYVSIGIVCAPAWKTRATLRARSITRAETRPAG